MFNKLPELILQGGSLFLMYQDYKASQENQNEWRQAYREEQEVTRQLREDLTTMHNNYMDAMRQAQQGEVNVSAIRRNYLDLVSQLEDAGMRVDSQNRLITLEESFVDEEADLLEDLMDEGDELTEEE